MKRPELEEVSKHYSDIFKWVKIYLESDEDAQTLTNNLHYMAIKRVRNGVAIGIIIGWVTMLLGFSWVN